MNQKLKVRKNDRVAILEGAVLRVAFNNWVWTKQDCDKRIIFVVHEVTPYGVDIRAKGYGLFHATPQGYGKGRILIDEKYLEILIR